MSVTGLALHNFKKSFSSYLSLILSLAFTVIIIYNFQSIVFTDIFEGLQEPNRGYINIIIEVISVVLGCFLFFFVWYATNVFLTRRKREIGIYVFMGLSNQRIGKLYALETLFIGFAALFLGLGAGILLTQLFQMILLALSDISVELRFQVALEPVLITAGIYLAVYIFFLLKGYINIVRSSVLNMLSANRRNEYVRENRLLLVGKALLGVAVLSAGFYMAVKEGGMEVMQNLLAAVVLVIIGVYLLFGGFLPLLFQGLVGNKALLYRGERTLWINNIVYRMRKNYRTYAMTCVLMLCSVTALATSFAMKNRYDNIVRFRTTYSFQILSGQPDFMEEITGLIGQDNKVVYRNSVELLSLDASLIDTQYWYRSYGILPWSQMVRVAESAGLEPFVREPAEDEVISLSHVVLLSFITDKSNVTHTINGRTYREIDDSDVPYLGYMQESASYFLVNDKTYEELKPLGSVSYIYNFGIEDPENFAASRDKLHGLVNREREKGDYMGCVAIDPRDSEIEWIRVLYSLCIFVFMVFIVASGSILFMKLYNDAFEERGRYAVLRKIGCSGRKLRRAVSRELGCTYALPFIVMAVSAYFSVHALEKLMTTSLMTVYGACVLIVLAFFAVLYGLSVRLYYKNTGI